MYLEILPLQSVCKKRLEWYVNNHIAIKSNTKINIITAPCFKTEIGNFTKKWEKNFIVSDTIARGCNHYIFYQFDFTDCVTINKSFTYISSLRYPRRIKDVESWLAGKRTDILLSLIAINNNSLNIYSPKTKQFMSIHLTETEQDDSGRAYPKYANPSGLIEHVGYSGYSGVEVKQFGKASMKKIIGSKNMVAKKLKSNVESFFINNDLSI